MAVLFGVLAIIAGFIIPWLLGWIGVIVVAVLAAIAIVIAILKGKHRPEGTRFKFAGIVCAVVGLALAFVMQMALIAVVKKIKDDITDLPDEYPVMISTIDKLESSGVIGLVNAVKDGGYTSEQLNEELEAYKKLAGVK